MTAKKWLEIRGFRDCGGHNEGSQRGPNQGCCSSWLGPFNPFFSFPREEGGGACYAYIGNSKSIEDYQPTIIVPLVTMQYASSAYIIFLAWRCWKRVTEGVKVALGLEQLDFNVDKNLSVNNFSPRSKWTIVCVYSLTQCVLMDSCSFNKNHKLTPEDFFFFSAIPPVIKHLSAKCHHNDGVCRTVSQ